MNTVMVYQIQCGEYKGWWQVTIDNVPQSRYAPCAKKSADHFASCLSQKFGDLVPRKDVGE